MILIRLCAVLGMSCATSGGASQHSMFSQYLCTTQYITHLLFRITTGGVGKTTTSCCLGVQLAKHRKKVLLVSTDPAHNLSDAFCQKIGREPTPIHGFDNLSAMEIDPSQESPSDLEESDENDVFGQMFNDLQNSIPGIDEAMSFSELMKQVQQLDFDVVVFDTARK